MRTIGLLVFLAVFALDGAGLLLDVGLVLKGAETISGHVWGHWILGVPLILLQAIGAGGLGVHFYAKAQERQ